jgi:DNA polymerase-3 subunit epsilon
MSIENTPILAVDFETTGLNPKKDQILSIGFVAIENNAVKLSTAYHKVIKTKGKLDETNVVIHSITDDHKSQGESLQKVVEDLLLALAGKVMLVHFANIEKNFLTKACQQLYGVAPVFPMIDTLMLAKRRLDRSPTPYNASELRLFTLRERHLLPRYSAHNALLDALATAELFFAEVATMSDKQSLRLKSVLL